MDNRTLRQVRSSVEELAREALGLLFPPCCACCEVDLAPGQAQPLLCSPCTSRLVGPEVRFCKRCGSRIADDGRPADRCANCRSRRLPFDSVTPLGLYEGELKRAVLRLKRPGSEALGRALGQLLWKREGKRLAVRPVDYVLPVPMHVLRRLHRGTNSPEVVAESLASCLSTDHVPRLAARRGNPPEQARLPATLRLKNVRGTFRLRRRYPLDGASVLIVDDVMTTGATLVELARTLRKAGAVHVDAVVLARADLLE